MYKRYQIQNKNINNINSNMLFGNQQLLFTDTKSDDEMIETNKTEQQNEQEDEPVEEENIIEQIRQDNSATDQQIKLIEHNPACM